MRALFPLLLLAGCAAHQQAPRISCPDPVAIPAVPPRVRTAEQIASFAIRLELAREAERGRGNACAAALDELNAWIRSNAQ